MLPIFPNQPQQLEMETLTTFVDLILYSPLFFFFFLLSGFDTLPGPRDYIYVIDIRYTSTEKNQLQY